MAMPKVGKSAPRFKLKNQSGEVVELKDFLGKKNVLLYFYPKSLTSGCTLQAQCLRDSMDEFIQLDTVVLGVAPDPETKLSKFIEKEELNFDLLSDEDHELCEKYGVWAKKKLYGREYMGVLRTSFLIDKEGVLVHIFEKVNTKTHHQDVLEVLQSI